MGCYRYAAGIAADVTRPVAARWLLDLSASYLWDGFTFTVGADNLTNQYPTKVALNNQYDDRADGLQYSSLSPFGFNGRYWYAKVAYRF